MSKRGFVRVLAAAIVVATASAAVVSVGRAGTNGVSFALFVAPSQLTAGGQGLAFVKFTPDASGGSATHTSITFTFSGQFTGATPDAATSQDCGGLVGNTITCTIGTVQPGKSVKRFVTFGAGAPAPGSVGVSATVNWDGGSSGANGGGQVNSLTQAGNVAIVDGTAATGACKSGGASLQTSPVSSTVPQATAFSFGNASPSLTLPCTWGTAGVAPKTAATTTNISYVAGPQFGTPATVTIYFASLPVPLSKFVLRENTTFDPANPTAGTWTPVPACPTSTTLPPGAVDCLVGYQNGKVITATLLYAGTGGDPGYAG